MRDTSIASEVDERIARCPHLGFRVEYGANNRVVCPDCGATGDYANTIPKAIAAFDREVVAARKAVSG